MEFECDGKISFLNILSSPRNGAIAVDVYRKPTDTDRYLDFNSHHDSKHKARTAGTVLHRALHLPNSSEGKLGTQSSCAALKSNGYPSTFIQTSRLTKPNP